MRKATEMAEAILTGVAITAGGLICLANGFEQIYENAETEYDQYGDIVRLSKEEEIINIILGIGGTVTGFVLTPIGLMRIKESGISEESQEEKASQPLT
jgi:hypothetical protein